MGVSHRSLLLVTAAPLVTLGCVLTFRLPFLSVSDVVRVRADEGWQATGLEVNPGDRLTITYLAGEWSPWPGDSYDAAGSGGDPLCPCNVLEAASHAALIGRIGGADPFLIGREFDHVVGESGTLLLGINDTDLYDNSGDLEVLIEIGR